MSSVIRFMEALGQNPAGSSTDYAAAVASLDVDAGQKQALLKRDADGLAALLKGRAAMRCTIYESEE